MPGGGGLSDMLKGGLGGLLAGGAAGSILSGGLGDLLNQLQQGGQADKQANCHCKHRGCDSGGHDSGLVVFHDPL